MAIFDSLFPGPSDLPQCYAVSTFFVLHDGVLCLSQAFRWSCVSSHSFSMPNLCTIVRSTHHRSRFSSFYIFTSAWPRPISFSIILYFPCLALGFTFCRDGRDLQCGNSMYALKLATLAPGGRSFRIQPREMSLYYNNNYDWSFLLSELVKLLLSISETPNNMVS